MNVLICSAGRRVRLVDFVRETLSLRGLEGRVYATDMFPDGSAACHHADFAFSVPRVTDEHYIDVLSEIISEHQIDIVIPTIDPELEILARAKADLELLGAKVVVSDADYCAQFYSKRTTQAFFDAHNVLTPQEVNVNRLTKFPLFAKLDLSSCSVGACKVDSYDLALSLLEKNSSYVFQELLSGDEYTIDVYIDRKNTICSVVPRKRLEVRAGEVSKAITCKYDDLIAFIFDNSAMFEGAFGPITVQVMVHENCFYVIEINPRFGGGYPLTYLAGANFMDLIIRDVLQESQQMIIDWTDGLKMLRYDAEVLVDDRRI